MTCIVGIAENGRIYMGGDSAAVAGYSLSVRADEKIFVNGGFVFGFTTSFRMGNLLRYKLVVPKPPDNMDELMRYMNTDFVDAVRNCLKEGGFNKTDNGVESGGTFLVGHKGRLFHIESDYQVGESVNGYDACGCGMDIALGVLFATKGKRPRRRMEMALEAAAYHSAGVVQPFTFMTERGAYGG